MNVDELQRDLKLSAFATSQSIRWIPLAAGFLISWICFFAFNSLSSRAWSHFENLTIVTSRELSRSQFQSEGVEPGNTDSVDFQSLQPENRLTAVNGFYSSKPFSLQELQEERDWLIKLTDIQYDFLDCPLNEAINPHITFVKAVDRSVEQNSFEINAEICTSKLLSTSANQATAMKLLFMNNTLGDLSNSASVSDSDEISAYRVVNWNQQCDWCKVFKDKMETVVEQRWNDVLDRNKEHTFYNAAISKYKTLNPASDIPYDWVYFYRQANLSGISSRPIINWDYAPVPALERTKRIRLLLFCADRIQYWLLQRTLDAASKIDQKTCVESLRAIATCLRAELLTTLPADENRIDPLHDALNDVWVELKAGLETEHQPPWDFDIGEEPGKESAFRHKWVDRYPTAIPELRSPADDGTISALHTALTEITTYKALMPLDKRAEFFTQCKNSLPATDAISVVWFYEQNGQQQAVDSSQAKPVNRVFVLEVVTTPGGMLTKQSVTPRMYYAEFSEESDKGRKSYKETNRFVPSRFSELPLFTRDGWLLGYRYCSASRTEKQVAGEFLPTVKNMIASKFEGKSPPDRLAQEKGVRWIESILAQSFGTAIHGKTVPIESTTAFLWSRRLNGGDRWGWIQFFTFVLFATALIHHFASKFIPLFFDKNTAQSQVRFSLECLPLLGFLGTVVGISEAIIGAGNVLSESMVDRQQVIQQMTRSLGLAFDTTFVALSCSLLLMMFTSTAGSGSGISRILLAGGRKMWSWWKKVSVAPTSVRNTAVK